MSLHADPTAEVSVDQLPRVTGSRDLWRHERLVTSSRPRRPARAIRWFYLLFGCAVPEFRFIARPVGEMCRSLVSVLDLFVCSKQVLIFLFFSVYSLVLIAGSRLKFLLMADWTWKRIYILHKCHWMCETRCCISHRLFRIYCGHSCYVLDTVCVSILFSAACSSFQLRCRYVVVQLFSVILFYFYSLSHIDYCFLLLSAFMRIIMVVVIKSSRCCEISIHHFSGPDKAIGPVCLSVHAFGQ